MGTLNDIRQKLLSGYSTSRLIKEGYAKSSVNHVANMLKNSEPDTPAPSVPDEILELRQQREKIKLEKEIAELEANKDKLSDRVTALEKTLLDFQRQTINAVDTALFISLVEAGWSREKATEFANGFAEKIIKIEK